MAIGYAWSRTEGLQKVWTAFYKERKNFSPALLPINGLMT